MDTPAATDLLRRVRNIRAEAETLIGESSDCPAVWRNALRILACVRMLELNLEDHSGPMPGDTD